MSKWILGLSLVAINIKGVNPLSPQIKKGIQTVVEFAETLVFTNFGQGKESRFSENSIVSSINAAESTNQRTFKTLNKRIPLILLLAASYGTGVGFQYLDFYVLDTTPYITGLGLVLGYLAYEQLESGFEKFVEDWDEWGTEEELVEKEINGD